MAATELDIPTILKVASISQYLATQAISAANNFKGKYPDSIQAQLIYLERKAVNYRYSSLPSDPTLQGCANYLYALCGRYQLTALTILNNKTIALPVITGPNNVTVNVGQNATFSVSVASTVPATYQWYDSSHNLIPGATGLTYTVPNAQLTDSGKSFYMTATNVAGVVTSTTAFMVVNAQIVGYFTYSPTVDFYPILQTNSDPFVYGTSFNISHNSPISFGLPGAMPANQYMLIKVPIGESIKTIWNNTPLNNGQIPDSVFESIVQFGGYTYYASRGQISMDVSSPLTIS